MPAKAGIQNYLKRLDSRLRGDDATDRFGIFYECINSWKTTRIGSKCTDPRPGRRDCTTLVWGWSPVVNNKFDGHVKSLISDGFGKCPKSRLANPEE